jgi:hypothetical protein
MIGLYAFNSTVSVDNIKISGTQRNSAANSENKIEVLGYNVSNGNVEALVQLNKTDSGAKKVFMAVYKKATNELVKIGEIKDWAGAVKDFRTSIKVDGIEDFSTDTYDVSVFAWDMTGLTPVCAAASLN